MANLLSAEEMADAEAVALPMLNGRGMNGTAQIISRLLNEVRRSRALLKRIEFNGGEDCCPACYGTNPEFKTPYSSTSEQWGHKPDCELAALIGGDPSPPPSVGRVVQMPPMPKDGPRWLKASVRENPDGSLSGEWRDAGGPDKG